MNPDEDFYFKEERVRFFKKRDSFFDNNRGELNCGSQGRFQMKVLSSSTVDDRVYIVSVPNQVPTAPN